MQNLTWRATDGLFRARHWRVSSLWTGTASSFARSTDVGIEPPRSCSSGQGSSGQESIGQNGEASVWQTIRFGCILELTADTGRIARAVLVAEESSQARARAIAACLTWRGSKTPCGAGLWPRSPLGAGEPQRARLTTLLRRKTCGARVSSSRARKCRRTTAQALSNAHATRMGKPSAGLKQVR